MTHQINGFTLTPSQQPMEFLGFVKTVSLGGMIFFNIKNNNIPILVRVY